MRLLNISIKSFRAIGDEIQIKFDQNNIICLIGVNNSGKSSILHAYDYFVNDLEAKEDDFHGKIQNPIEITAKFQIESSTELTEMDIIYYKELETFISIKRVWIWEEKKSHIEMFNPQTTKWQKPEKKHEDFLKKILLKTLPKPIWIKGLSNPNEVVQEIQSIIQQAIFEKLKESREYKALLASITAFRDLVAIDRYTGELRDRVTLTMRDVFPSISLDIQNQSDNIDTILKSFGKDTLIKASEGNGPQLGLDHYGHGVQRHFILSFYKNCFDILRKIKASTKTKKRPEDFEFDKSILKTKDIPQKTKILLLEEPELFLHPNAIRTVQNFLYELAVNSEYQILCATHSPIMVDLSREHSSLVRLVPDKNRGTACYQVDSSLFENGTRNWLIMLKEFNSYVNESFFASYVFLVEGATEEIVIKILLDKIQENTTLKQDILIINCNGKATIPHFQKILYHFKIPYVVFHDLDYRKNSDGTNSPSWKINEKIWEGIQTAQNDGLEVKRYIFNPVFEKAHGYELQRGDKPYTAYAEVKSWLTSWNSLEVEEKPIIKYVKSSLGLNDFNETFDQAWVEKQDPGQAPKNYTDTLQLSFMEEFFDLLRPNKETNND